MSDERFDLTEVPTSTLERLRSAIGGGQLATPLSRSGLVHFGITQQLDAIADALSGHSRLACLSVLDVALAERARAARPAPELVWTGPERQNATARDTAVVLRALFESAESQVILAGFSFTRGSAALAPLHQAMRARSLDVRFFIHVEQVGRGEDPDEKARDAVASFVSDAWPFGRPVPRIFVDRRSLEPGPPYSSLHAKCVVVDGERSFLSSANFSARAQEQNIEAGVLIHDPAFSQHLARQWIGLIEANLVVEVGTS